ncbi:MAG: cell envelope integrity protein CreD [Bacteroidales bacterium]|nr:cell envelope integrity protein CreD [Bacteroidales bacterium]
MENDNYIVENAVRSTSASSKEPQNRNKFNLSFSMKIMLKIFVIVILSLLLLIPKMMINNLIDEREDTAQGVTDEIAKKWGKAQCIAGPFIYIPAKNEGKNKASDDLILFPETLNLNGNINSQNLHRSIYDIAVYDAPLSMEGVFCMSKYVKDNLLLDKFQLDHAKYMFYIRDLRGLSKNVEITANQQKGIFQSKGAGFIVCDADVQNYINGDTVSYAVELDLKGSEGLYILPCAGTTSVKINSNSSSPSFTGGFLPNNRNVSENGFTADWQIIALNKSYAQYMYYSDFTSRILSQGFYDYTKVKALNELEHFIGISLKTGVNQYQQNTRAVKYAYLIIILTFITVFIVEILKSTPIHIIQYMLIGVALVLFYCLLLSFSEFISFSWAYLIAAIMIIGMITAYIAAILKIKKTAIAVGALLSALYIYIFILLRLETLSLLVGSIGLFVILALIMIVSRKIDWYK